jgi:uncharacterized RDD family membrane protein YckC
MSETEPVLLRDQADGPVRATPAPATRPSEPPARASVRQSPAVYVVGFWKRFVAAAIDFAVIVPVALIITWLVSAISGVRLPAETLHLLDVDLWIDLLLATDPAIIMALVLFIAIGMTYLLVFHIVVGRTLGMRVMKLRIIDIYGDRPSPARCVGRCAGYLASAATLFLGFLWMGFDSEKRALHDWIAGTYVIRA